ncbi:unnamed protein product, partial [Oppiella nova]
MSETQNKICVICGAKSNGYHFDVISCESCKSFFRRNALRNMDLFQCFFGGNCEIHYQNKNRKLCKKCRLKKCFKMGMESKLIYSDKQKELRRALIENNKKRKNQMIAHKKRLVSSDEKSQDITNSCDNLEINTFNTQVSAEENIQTDNNNNEIIENNLNHSLMPIVNPVSDYSVYFNELEDNKLSELLNALKHLEKSVDIISQTFVDTFRKAFAILQSKVEIEAQNIVKMSKCLDTFNNICESDQKILIKHSAIEINILRMLPYFNYEYEYWNII